MTNAEAALFRDGRVGTPCSLNNKLPFVNVFIVEDRNGFTITEIVSSLSIGLWTSKHHNYIIVQIK